MRIDTAPGCDTAQRHRLRGYISLPQMARVGVGLNVIGIVLITLVALLWLPMAWGIDLGTLPTEFAEAWSG